MLGYGMSQDNFVAKLIADLRVRLLDLRNGNKLLSYRHSERAKTHIRIIDELPEFLHESLTTGKVISFRSLPDPQNDPPDEKTEDFLMALEEARRLEPFWTKELNEEEAFSYEHVQKKERELRDQVRSQLNFPVIKSIKGISISEWALENGYEPSFDLPYQNAGVIQEKHSDNEIQTLLLPDVLQGKLAGLLDHARTAQEERGVNLLYMAIGFLEWYESPIAEKPMLAPLLLYPAELIRKPWRSKGVYRYFLSGEHEPIINITLRQRLAIDHNLIVPDFEEFDTVEKYFLRIAKLISEIPRWRIRRFATLGLFSFSRIVMYHDLDPQRWGGEDKLCNSGVLGDLFGYKEAGTSAADTYDFEDPKVEAEVPLLILDADSSQHQAIIDVLRGRSQVIKGPPGTGKSQTIANIIAASLAKGKKILFVAEKAAALDVVKKRLDEAGFGDFCFELHSTKAKKTDIIAGLNRRLRLSMPKARIVIDASLAELRTLRERLSRHVNIMNLPFGALEVNDRGCWRRATIHDILWAEQRTRQAQVQIPEIDSVFFSDAMKTNRFVLEHHKQKLLAIEELVLEFTNSYGRLDQHPWSIVSRTNLQVLDLPNIEKAVSSAVLRLDELLKTLSFFAGRFDEIKAPQNLIQLLSFAESLASLPVPDESVNDQLLRTALGSNNNVQEIRGAISILKEIRKVEHKLSQLFNGPVDNGFIWDEGLAKAIEYARRSGISGRTLSEIEEDLGGIRRKLEKWDKVFAYAKKILSLIGIDTVPVTVTTIRRAIKALEIVSCIDRQILLFRFPAAINETSLPIFEVAKTTIEKLKRDDIKFRNRFFINKSISISDIREASKTLSTTVLGGKLGSKYRTAKAYALSLLKSSGTKDNHFISTQLLELADHLESLQAFEQDETIKSICGQQFYGHNTNIDVLISVNLFVSQIRSSFPGMDEPDFTIRQFIIESDNDSLCAFQALSSDSLLESLKKELESIDDQGSDLNLKHDRLFTHAKKIEFIQKLLSSKGFRQNITPGQAAEMQGVILHRQRLTDAMSKSPGASIIGQDTWKGVKTDLACLESVIHFVDEFSKRNFSQSVFELLVKSDVEAKIKINEIRTLGVRLKNDVSAAISSIRSLSTCLDTDGSVGKSEGLFTSEPVSKLTERIKIMALSPDKLMSWVIFRQHVTGACEDGLKQLLDAYDQAEAPYLHLVAAYDRVLYRSLAQSVLEHYPELGETKAVSLDELRSKFRALDQQVMEMRRQALIAKLASTSIPHGVNSPRKGECTEFSLLRHEVAKKKRHIPIRNLLDRASNAIREMKPCMMMSPASVAQYLQTNLLFDMLIIDESSQVRPEEVISALARAKQAIIVGDPQQLPPSSFFQRQDSDALEGDGEEEYEMVAAESILDLARTAFHPSRELLWHYRSRHGALIAFSNRHFYEDQLIVFPSPQEGHPDYGVNLHAVDGKYRAGINVPEAQAVAHAAADLMAKHPEKSIGIVALNQPQRDLILSEMDRLFIRDPVAGHYRENWQKTLEPFIVKNLENVQGDERDIILISTVYGPDENGNFMQRFGPINGPAGDRRLNVLFSRAKHGITVFSSMKPDQIRVDASTPRGTRLLRDYLQFAATGRLDSGHVPFKDCDSDFERVVKENLEVKGYDVVAQVGVAGFWIDLGVRHPKWPYGFLLGIECDGASYHSTLSARDRDRLRQQILENLGWTIYRIWSTDWFRDKNREVSKVISFIDKTLTMRLAEQKEIEDEQLKFVQQSNQKKDTSGDYSVEQIEREEDIEIDHLDEESDSAKTDELGHDRKKGGKKEAKKVSVPVKKETNQLSLFGIVSQLPVSIGENTEEQFISKESTLFTVLREWVNVNDELFKQYQQYFTLQDDFVCFTYSHGAPAKLLPWLRGNGFIWDVKKKVWKLKI